MNRLRIPSSDALRPASPLYQRGIGLVHVMLILLLVGSALAAGALLMQAKRAPQAAITQEQTLRWADEALAAFASANARLPCPADTIGGEENCTAGRAKGWLPTRTLVGASGTGITIGPVAYMVYRGDEATHLDLTRPGNAYQPPLTDGSIRGIGVKDSKGVQLYDDADNKITRPFLAINGLDLCRSLEIAEATHQASPADATLANVDGHDGSPRNIAYGIAAAGPLADDNHRLDDGNSGNVARMEAPWREWDSGYDDRVRIRSFDSVGQTLGCRLLADLPATGAASTIAPYASAAAPSASTPYNIALASVDVLAASVTVHDDLAELQITNLDAAEAAVTAATNAQISLIFELVTTAMGLTDQITTLVTTTINLARSVVTCIASLGTMCWEVPLKAGAVATSIVGLGQDGVTLAQKAAALAPTAMALDLSLKARDLAREGAKPPAQDIDAAKKQMECTLYALNCPADGVVKMEPNPDFDPDNPLIPPEIPVCEKDDNGNPALMIGPDGKPMLDGEGKAICQPVYEVDPNRIGLKEEVANSKAESERLRQQESVLVNTRLLHWGFQGLNADGSEKLNDNMKYRINEAHTLNEAFKHHKRYRKEVQYETCDYLGPNKGGFVLEGTTCKYVGVETVGDPPVQRPKGDRVRVTHVRYELDHDLAMNDAKLRRRKAQEWTELNLRTSEVKHELELYQNNYDNWFDGKTSILSRMQQQRDDMDCAKDRGKCDSADEAIAYVDTCQKVEIDSATGKPTFYTDADGRLRPKTTRDTDPQAACRLNMQDRINEAAAEASNLEQNRSNAESAYRNLPSPSLDYPDGWETSAFEISIDPKTKEVLASVWSTDSGFSRPGSPLVPYYAPEPYAGGPNTISGGELLLTSGLEIKPSGSCPFLNMDKRNLDRKDPDFQLFLLFAQNPYKDGLYCQRYPYSRAYEDWLRAKTAADLSHENYLGLKAKFEQLEREYKALQDASDPSGGNSIAIGFGAEPALERADARGSVGAQEMIDP